MRMQELYRETGQSITNYYDEVKEKHPNTCNTVQDIGSVTLACYTGKSVFKIMKNKIRKPVFTSCLNEIGKNGNIVTKEEVFKGFEDTKLFEKYGVFLHDYSEGYPIFENRIIHNRLKEAKKEQKILGSWDLWENNPQKAQRKLNQRMKIGKIKDYFFKPYNKLKEKLVNNKVIKEVLKEYIAVIFEPYEEVLSGKNAFYTEKFNDININIDKIGIASFHEMGHAMNYNKKGVGHCLCKLRPAKILLPLIFLTALLRKPKKQGEKSDTILGKGLDFVKDNCVSLTALCSAPVIMEEFMASQNGMKIAKNVLSPDKLKILKRFQAKAWMTYVASGLASIATVWAVDKVRNFTSSRKD